MIPDGNRLSGRQANINPAYVLGLGTAGLSVLRSLSRAGVPVIGVDSKPGNAGSYSRYCQTKSCPSPIHQKEELIDFFKEETGRLGAPGILFPCNDEFSLFVSRYRAELEPNFRIAMPSREVMEAMIDKRKQYEWAEASGVPYPATFYPETAEDVRLIQSQLEYPVFIKPCFGYLWREHFPCKGFKADNATELKTIFEKVHAAGLQAIVQSIVLGPPSNMYSFAAYIGDGPTPLAEFVQRKIRQLPHDFGVGTLVESCDCPELAELGRRFLRCLQYRGIGEIEFKRDNRDGKFKLIELNTRFWLQVALAQSCGVNFPLIQYLDLCGHKQNPRVDFKVGIQWLDAVPDFWSSLAYYRSGELPLHRWLGSWLRSRSFATFSLADPKPFFKTAMLDFGEIGKSFLSKALARVTSAARVSET